MLAIAAGQPALYPTLGSGRHAGVLLADPAAFGPVCGVPAAFVHRSHLIEDRHAVLRRGLTLLG